MQINSRSVLEICFHFDRVSILVSVGAAATLPGRLGAAASCCWAAPAAASARSYDSISICVLFIAPCACLCMFLLQFTYNVWACVGVFALSAKLFLYCVCVSVCPCRRCMCARELVVSAFGLLSFSSLDIVANYVMSSLIILNQT